MALNNVGSNIGRGIVGSLVGGMVFGMLMTMMGMMTMVANLVRSDSVAVGWMVHLAISTVFGVAFGLLLSLVNINPVLTGLAWGMVAWVGGALILMPLFLGMPDLVLNLSGSTPWFSLMGHMMYGLVAGLVAWALARREAARSAGRRPSPAYGK